MLRTSDLLSKLLTRGFEAFGTYYGTYKGFVVDREDPKHYGRLKLNIPNVTGKHVLNYWAYPSNCYSGNGYGSQILPNVGDLVWVEFEQGNTRRPLWKFGYFGKGEKPEALEDYNNFWFKTPGGHLVELDDTTGIIKITGKAGIRLYDSTDESEQPMVLGDSLFDKLTVLIDLLLLAKTNTSIGPQPLFNILQDLENLKTDLGEIKSDNKTIGT